MRSSLESITCTSWLVYATRATGDRARRVKSLILDIKQDRVDPKARQPVVELVIEHAMRRAGSQARMAFGGHPILVPVPGSSLTRLHSIWPARRICEALRRAGLGDDVLPVIRRATAVPKSAGSSERPSLAEHVRSLFVQKGLRAPRRFLLVDDVVTTGTTLMACWLKLREAFPSVPVDAFAVARVQSTGEPDHVFAPLVERIVAADGRCKRTGINR